MNKLLWCVPIAVIWIFGYLFHILQPGWYIFPLIFTAIVVFIWSIAIQFQ